MTKTIVIDGDDTLWWTEPMYDVARDRASRIVEEALGIDEWAFDRLQKEIDGENFKTYGVTRERFPTSSVQAYDRLCEVVEERIDPDIRQSVWDAADTVFTDAAEVHGHANLVLSTLREIPDARLVLYTKGDREVQQKRVVDSRLGNFFDKVEICDHKTALDLVRIVEEGRGDHRDVDLLSQAVMIGNSYGSDIVPALEAGMWAIWIEAYTWIAERKDRADGWEHERLREAFSLSEVPSMVGAIFSGAYSNA